LELANTRKLEEFCQYGVRVTSKKSFGSLSLGGKIGKTRVLVDEVKRTVATLPEGRQPAHLL